MGVVSGHLALPIMLGALCEEGEAQLLGEARALYENHERDAGDTILMAFRAHNWTKVSACTSWLLGSVFDSLSHHRPYFSSKELCKCVTQWSLSAGA